MTIPVEPYLAVLRSELATTLLQQGDENAKRSATYCHRILTSLIAESETLPELHNQALVKLGDILDSLCAELVKIEGGAVLTAELIQHIRVRPDYRSVEPFLQQAVVFLISVESPESKTLLQTISSITFDIHHDFYEATCNSDFSYTEGSGSNTGLTTEQVSVLQKYLRVKVEGEAQLEIDGIKIVVGGGSKLTMFVDLKNNKTLPDTVVLRKDNNDYGSVVGSTVADEYFLIDLMNDAGVPGAEPYLLETDSSVLGSPFMIVSRVEGQNIGDWIYVTEPSRDFAIELAQALAKMHTVPLDRVGDRLSGHDSSVSERMVKDIASFEHSWRALRQPNIALEQAYAWLKANISYANGQRVVIHCDAGCHNMLGKDGHLTAILDWETAVVGNPAQDLTYVRTAVVQMMPWDEFLAEYEQAGGTIPTQAEMDFYELWRCVFQIHWLFIARSYVLSGLSQSVVHAYGSQRLYQHMDCDLHRAVKDLYERY